MILVSGVVSPPQFSIAGILAGAAAVLFVVGFVGLVPAATVIPYLLLTTAGAVGVLSLVDFPWPVGVCAFLLVALVPYAGFTRWGWPL